MAINSIYLRPSADISVGHTFYPTTSSSGYLLIDDETYDGDSTCLTSSSADANTVSTLTSSFKLSGAIPSEKFNIRDAKIVYRVYTNSYFSSGTISFIVSVNGSSFTSSSISVSGSTAYSTEKTDITFGNVNFVNVINNYISSNGEGSFPEVTISFTTSHTGSSKGAGSLNITQVYLELIYDIDVYRKVNGEWKNALYAMKKTDGVWVKYPTPRTTLSVGVARLGHEQIAVDSIAPTCTETGLTKGYKCSICGEWIEKQVVIAANGHKSSVINAVEPTCTTPGLTIGYKCSVCGDILTPQEEVPATGEHTYIASGGHNICPSCGYVYGIGYTKMKYYGKIENLSFYSASPGIRTTTVGDYALFVGGYKNNSCVYTVDVYNSTLTKSNAPNLSIYRRGPGATTVGNYALFAGGQNFISSDNNLMTDTVDVYNSTLTKSTAPNLSTAAYRISATTVGDYALFAGGACLGSTWSVTVDAYNATLTKFNAPDLINTGYLSSTTVGDYAIFISTARNTSIVYDASLTQHTIEHNSINDQTISATTVGNYALFAEFAIDKFLTKHSFHTGNTSTRTNNATTVGNYALFAGGSIRTENDVHIFDVSLVKSIGETSITGITEKGNTYPRFSICASTVGNYALFAGGEIDVLGDDGNYTGYIVDDVEVYKLESV